MALMVPLVTPVGISYAAESVADVTVSDSILTITRSQEEELRSFFDEYGVANSVADALIEALENGRPWLSLTETAEPVESRTYVDKGFDVTVETFADGSIVARKTQTAGPAPNTLSRAGARVYGCQVTRAPGYAQYSRNCVADNNWGVIRMYFNFNWEHIKHSPPKITRYWNYQYHIVIGSLSNHRWVKNSNQDVRYVADGRVPGAFTATIHVGVKVGSGTAFAYYA